MLILICSCECCEFFMGLDYDLVELPGLPGIIVPMVKRAYKNDDDNNTGSRAIEWVVLIDKIYDKTTSNIAGKEAVQDGAQKLETGMEKTIEVLGWYAEGARHTNPEAYGSLYTGGTIWHSEIIMIIPSGEYIPTLENHLVNGTVITKITISNLANINDATRVLQSIMFETCHLRSVQADLDRSIIRFTAVKKTNVVNSYNNDGTHNGMAAFDVNFASNVVNSL